MNILKKIKLDGKSNYKKAAFVLIMYIITVIAVVFGRASSDSYSLEVGDVSPIKFKATKPITNEVATEKARKSAEDSVATLYKIDQSVNTTVDSNIAKFFEFIDSARADYKEYVNTVNNADNQDAANSDVEKENLDEKINELVDEEPQMRAFLNNTIENYDKNTQVESMTETNLMLLLTINDEQYKAVVESVKKVTEELLKQGITDDSLQKNSVYAKDMIEKEELTDDEKSLCYELTMMFIQPNMIVDTEATEEAKTKAKDAVEPITLRKDQTIVDEGQLITEESLSMLENLGLVNQKSGINNITNIGVMLIILLLFIILIAYIEKYKGEISQNGYVGALFIVIVMGTIIAMPLLNVLPIYFSPVLLCVFLVSALVDNKIGLVLSIILPIINLLILNVTEAYLDTVYIICVSAFITIVAKMILERSKIFIVTVTTTMFAVVTQLSISLMTGMMYRNMGMDGYFNQLMLAGIGMLMISTITVGSIPLWEVAFKIVTPVKLLDLTKPTNELLRRLTIEAPGTYQHSLMVANLAEEAAYAIGANGSIVRVGAYYHDVGKLKYPSNFAENQMGVNPHDNYTPLESANIIKEHVKYGEKLAKEQGLPSAIIDFINQHHGNTIIKYFYFKALDDEKLKDSVKESDYRYEGVVPQNREIAILMLADTVEAAVRSMMPKAKDMGEVATFVDILISGKIEDGQMIDSGLTFKDIEIIKKSFINVFTAMYHTRVEYPNK